MPFRRRHKLGFEFHHGTCCVTQMVGLRGRRALLGDGPNPFIAVCILVEEFSAGRQPAGGARDRETV